MGGACSFLVCSRVNNRHIREVFVEFLQFYVYYKKLLNNVDK